METTIYEDVFIAYFALSIKNIATGEMSQVITYFDYFDFLHDLITFIKK